MTQQPDGPRSERSTTVVVGPPGGRASSWRFLREGDVALDLPGHGGQVAVSGWSLDMLAQDLVDQFVGPLHLVGLAGAADLMLTLLTQWGKRIRSAVLVCPDVVAAAAPAQRAARTERRRQLAELATGEGTGAVADRLAADLFTPVGRRTGVAGVQQGLADIAATDARAYAEACTVAERSSAISEDRLAAVTVPVTLVAGTLDRAVGADPAVRLHALLPASRLELWPAPHWGFLERPEQVRTLVDRHGIWAPVGNRVDRTLGSGILMDRVELPWGGAA